MKRTVRSGVVLLVAIVLCGCAGMDLDTTQNPPGDIQSYAGVVASKSEQYQGKVAPATLVTVPTEDGVVCRMIFFVAIDSPVLLTGTVRDTQDSRLSGVWKDPRGWDVTWKIHIQGNTISGTFKQPHDFGDISLKRIP